MFFASKWIIAVLIYVIAAFIPARIASKKGYNALLFYIYGLLIFVIALLHSIILKDKSKTADKAYSNKAIIFSVLSVIFYYYYMLMMVMLSFSTDYVGVTAVLFIIAGKIPMLLFLISLVLARKYYYSIAIYVINIVNIIVSVCNLKNTYIYWISQGQILKMVTDLVCKILGLTAMIILIAVVLKYMIGRSELKPGYGFIFIMPMIIEFLATIISWSNSSFIFEIVKTASGYTMHYLPLVIGEVLYILAILFLGLFYMEDADKAVQAASRIDDNAVHG